MRRRLLRQPGFTLMETLIALVISVVILGGSSLAARAIQENVRRTEERTQMASLAQESLDTMRFLRDSLKLQGRALAEDNGGVDLNAGNNDDIAEGSFVARPDSFTNCQAAGSCPNAQSGGPLVLRWC